MKASPIAPTVDFDRDGVQHGFLRLPYSRDESAWGNLMTPVTVVKRGNGPTALLTGANHGDEYEGPVALVDLAATLDPADVTGRVIILPFMELSGLPRRPPAVADRRRQHEPHLSGPAGRHRLREDRGLHSEHSGADGGPGARLPFGRAHARFPAVRRLAHPSRQGAGRALPGCPRAPSARPMR